jgi:hypothetical protein
LNQLPDLDFERTVSMVLHVASHQRQARLAAWLKRQGDAAEDLDRTVLAVLQRIADMEVELGLAVRRLPGRSAAELARLGQKRLRDYP